MTDPTSGTKEVVSKVLMNRNRVLAEVWSKNNYVPISVGQVVFIYDRLPRDLWKMGVITELLHSLDNFTRSVKLTTTSGSLVRTITKPYPFEVQRVEPQYKIDQIAKVERPKRDATDAARVALEKINLRYEQ